MTALRPLTGASGEIGPGDVQWMTAGAGILHEEFHSADYARRGGPFEMVQLWVNLPTKDKMTPPGYQAILNGDIPVRALNDASGEAAGQVRVIAGEFDGARGPAHTFTPLNVWDVRVKAGKSVSLAQPEGWTSLLVVLDGTVQLNGETGLRAAQMATLSAAGREIAIEADSDAKLLLLAGEPIAEPVVGYGPFVMTSQAEIRQAIEDFNASLNVDNKNPNGWAGLGVAYEKQGNRQKAAESYQRALVIDSSNPIARSGASRVRL